LADALSDKCGDEKSEVCFHNQFPLFISPSEKAMDASLYFMIFTLVGRKC